MVRVIKENVSPSFNNITVDVVIGEINDIAKLIKNNYKFQILPHTV